MGSATAADENDGEQVRHEYGGGKGDATSALDVVPGNKRRLREALGVYKRRLEGFLKGEEVVTAEVGEVGRAFAEVEEWVWRFGWDLREGDGKVKRVGAGEDGEDEDMDEEEEEGDDYQPVIVDLDGDGREVGLVSFS